MIKLSELSRATDLRSDVLLKIFEANGYDVHLGDESLLSEVMIDTLQDFIEDIEDTQGKDIVLNRIQNFKDRFTGKTSNTQFEHVGVVTFFDAERGFGFIESINIPKIFVHISNIKDKIKPQEEDVVAFKLKKSDKKEGEFVAYKVLPLKGQLFDYKWLLNYGLASKNPRLLSAISKILPRRLIENAVLEHFNSWLNSNIEEKEFRKIWQIFLNRLPNGINRQFLKNLIGHIQNQVQDIHIRHFILSELLPKGDIYFLESLLLSTPACLSLDIETIKKIFKINTPWFDDHKVDLEEKIRPLIPALDRVKLYLDGIFQAVTYQDVIECGSGFTLKGVQLLVRSNLIEPHQKLLLLRDFLYDNPIWENFQQILIIIEETVSEEGLTLFKTKMAELDDESELHIILWLNGANDMPPLKYLKEKWKSGEFLEKIEKWQDSKKLKSSDIVECLWSNILELKNINNRKEYDILQRHLYFVYLLDEDTLWEQEEHTDPEVEPFVNVWLWLEADYDFIDIKDIQKVLIYLSPETQIKALRKLFYFKHSGRINFSVADLDQILRIDDDIYELNQKHHPDVFLDISVAIVVSLIKSLHDNKTFLSETNLMAIALENITSDRKRKFIVKDLFEKCPGRTTCSWTNTGKITKQTSAEGEIRFVLSFDYDEDLVDAIKTTFPQRQYSREDQTWSIPARYEQQILDFAQEHRLLLEFDGNDANANRNLIDINLGAKPRYILFCEGRPANNRDRKFNRPFWWCLNQACFQNAETIHTPEQWEQYTLLDFLLIMGFNLDSHNKIDYIEKGKYYQFVGTVNRFTRLLERLYCDHCEEILSPSRDSHFAYYRVTRFYCSNVKCPKHGTEIYLHHCLNGHCANIIDSRVSKKCKNGWTICDNTQCGCCCSHEQYEKRLSNLEKVGGYFMSETREAVKNRIGHLERAMHFCYKCGDLMKETERETFKCTGCNITYNLKRNFFKRTHKNFENSGSKSSSEFFPDREY